MVFMQLKSINQYILYIGDKVVRTYSLRILCYLCSPVYIQSNLLVT